MTSPNTVFQTRSDLRSIGVTGADAAPFLQGQLTADCASLSAGAGTIAALCANDGRVVCVVRLFRLEQGFAVSVADPLAEELMAHLQRHRLRARVAIDAIDASCHVVTCIGPPQRALAHIDHPGGLSDLLVAGGASTPADPAAAYATAVAFGLPDILPATRALFLPQWLNLDLLGGISFTKGYYLGQEIVARTHHRGRIARRLLRVAHAGPPLAPGTPLPGDGAPGQVILGGCGEDGSEALAVVRVEAYAELSRNGFVPRPLPYPLPELPPA